MRRWKDLLAIARQARFQVERFREEANRGRHVNPLEEGARTTYCNNHLRTQNVSKKSYKLSGQACLAVTKTEGGREP